MTDGRRVLLDRDGTIDRCEEGDPMPAPPFHVAADLVEAAAIIAELAGAEGIP